jgi:hypothetical protein
MFGVCFIRNEGIDGDFDKLIFLKKESMNLASRLNCFMLKHVYCIVDTYLPIPRKSKRKIPFYKYGQAGFSGTIISKV